MTNPTKAQQEQLDWYDAIETEEFDMDLNLNQSLGLQLSDMEKVINKEGMTHQLSLLRQLYNISTKCDPDLTWLSGLKYKSELDDCGISVDGHVKGNGWKIEIMWEMENHILWSPNLRALLDSALRFLKERVKV